MASFETVKRVVLMMRSISEFPLVPAQKDEAGNMTRPGTLETWHFALEDLSDEDVLAGGRYLMSSWTDEFKRKPMPGDIRGFIQKLDTPDVGQVWSEIEEKKFKFVSADFDQASGRCLPPSWSSPFVAEVVKQMGGIETFLTMKTSQEPTIRAQLRDVCKGIAERKAASHITQPLLATRAMAAIQTAKPEQIAEARQALNAQLKQDVLKPAEIADRNIRAGFDALRQKFEDRHKLTKALNADRVAKAQAAAKAQAEALGYELKNLMEGGGQ